VEGRVQGVFFREGARLMATRLGVDGWVRNLPDGRVEAVFEGEPQRVAAAVEWARQGPERALVTGMELHGDEPLEESLGFEVRH
jgi:acylphosphatase